MSFHCCRISFQAWCGTSRMLRRTLTVSMTHSCSSCGHPRCLLQALWQVSDLSATMHACSRSSVCSHTHLLSPLTKCCLLICNVVVGLIAALVTRRYGRRLTMVVGELMLVCYSSTKDCQLEGEEKHYQALVDPVVRWPGISHWNWAFGWSCPHQHALSWAGLSRHWRRIC